MRSIHQWFFKRGRKKAGKSTLNWPAQGGEVLVLTGREQDGAVVRKFFPEVHAVVYVPRKAPKDGGGKPALVHRNELGWTGEPKHKIPTGASARLVLNLEQDPAYLTWYWYAHTYAFRVDLQGTYEEADLAITGAYSLEEKLATLTTYLQKTTS